MLFKQKDKAYLTKDFLNLFKKAFPTIQDNQLNSLDQMLQQFRKRSFELRGIIPSFEEMISIQTTKYPSEILMQGDIIDNLPLISIDENGDLTSISGPAVVISASCDCENDDNIILAGCITSQEACKIVKNSKELRNNMYFKFFSFNNSSDDTKSVVADFSRVSTYSKSLILQRISEGKLLKSASLTQLGYYFFITKLYIHLLRIEQDDALEIRI
jgi:hypothetical protein